MAIITPKRAVIAALWLIGTSIFWYIEFLAVFVIVSGLVFIFMNTSTRTSGPSAYSVFNRDGERLTGTFDTSTMEAMVTGRSFAMNNPDGGPKYAGPVFQNERANSGPRPPKPQRRIGRNEPCYCGSRKKYKACCALLDDAQNESDSESD